MSNPDLYNLYDDEDAIAFIRKTLSPEQNKALDDDDLYNVIDLVTSITKIMATPTKTRIRKSFSMWMTSAATSRR